MPRWLSTCPFYSFINGLPLCFLLLLCICYLPIPSHDFLSLRIELKNRRLRLACSRSPALSSQSNSKLPKTTETQSLTLAHPPMCNLSITIWLVRLTTCHVCQPPTTSEEEQSAIRGLLTHGLPSFLLSAGLPGIPKTSYSLSAVPHTVIHRLYIISGHTKLISSGCTPVYSAHINSSGYNFCLMTFDY